MNILFLHYNPFDKVRYDLAVDHTVHRVIYAGAKKFLDQIPPELSCIKIELLDAEEALTERFEAQLATLGGVERVMTRSERCLGIVAELNARWKLPGMSVEVTERFRDKVKMKAAILAAGLKAPQFLAANQLNLNEANELQLPWQGATIVKPIAEAGSAGVISFQSAEEALHHLSGMTPEQREHLELEEYFAGPIYHVDGYLHQGECVSIQSSCYLNNCLDFAHGKPLGSIQCDRPDLEDFALRCLKALGGETLTFHLELIESALGPVFLECAARAGGAEVVRAFQFAKGVHLHQIDIASQVEQKLALKPRTRARNQSVFGFLIFPGHVYDGKPVRLQGDTPFRGDPHILKWQQLSPSQPTPLKSTYQSKELPLALVTEGENFEELKAWMEVLVENVNVVPIGA